MHAQNLTVVQTDDQKSLAIAVSPNKTLKLSNVPNSSGRKDFEENFENDITMPKTNGKTKNIKKLTVYGPKNEPTDNVFLAMLIECSRFWAYSFTFTNFVLIIFSDLSFLGVSQPSLMDN